jgi:small-conductance mechanosensitive channel
MAYSQPLPASSQSAASGVTGESSQDVVKEIEVLKQQLRVYVDDFTCERQDRERMQNEKEKLETELRDVHEEVAVLKEQVIDHFIEVKIIFLFEALKPNTNEISIPRDYKGLSLIT